MEYDVQKLFEEPGLIQITTWARGVIQNKDARDVVFALANAASKEGKYVQAWENYVDLPDRVNVPVRAYARISPNPIESKYIYENENPDVVVLTEEGLVKGNNVLKGLKPGGVLIVNTKRDPEYILKFLSDTSNLGILGCVDATGVTGYIKTLSGAEGATDASGIGAGVGAVLAGAAAKAKEMVKLENLLGTVKNQDACRYGYENVKLMKVNEVGEVVSIGKIKQNKYDLEGLPFAGTVPSPKKENEGMVTGNWRTERPILTKELCNDCLICWLDCPDATIFKTEDGLIDFDLKYCKGCGICAAVCPTEAVTMVPELDFVD
ncbi:MAG: 2-oxoacid:acceptor oxidoreductase family protein [Thermoanaerobacteraceae bacterium]|nr:2-oxoacid:acceptor oxidoreductase family protein [Thermoanaerobacteraceae bacterium]